MQGVQLLEHLDRRAPLRYNSPLVAYEVSRNDASPGSVAVHGLSRTGINSQNFAIAQRNVVQIAREEASAVGHGVGGELDVASRPGRFAVAEIHPPSGVASDQDRFASMYAGQVQVLLARFSPEKLAVDQIEAMKLIGVRRGDKHSAFGDGDAGIGPSCRRVWVAHLAARTGTCPEGTSDCRRRLRRCNPRAKTARLSRSPRSNDLRLGKSADRRSKKAKRPPDAATAIAGCCRPDRSRTTAVSKVACRTASLGLPTESRPWIPRFHRAGPLAATGAPKRSCPPRAIPVLPGVRPHARQVSPYEYRMRPSG